MQRRIFVGVPIPDDIKKRIFHVVKKDFWDLPVAWTPKENYHLTLNFLGFTLEENIPEICDAIREAVAEEKFFEVEFSVIESGPSQKSKRLVWITGAESQELSALKSNLDQSLVSEHMERRKFIPHVTLGRIKKGGPDALRQVRDLKRKINFSVPVNSVELYESKFEKGKRIYYVMESFELGTDEDKAW
jgi:RNA 2',3'-cyclic 3'-phosphodiesterase